MPVTSKILRTSRPDVAPVGHSRRNPELREYPAHQRDVEQKHQEYGQPFGHNRFDPYEAIPLIIATLVSNFTEERPPADCPALSGKLVQPEGAAAEIENMVIRRDVGLQLAGNCVEPLLAALLDLQETGFAHHSQVFGDVVLGDMQFFGDSRDAHPFLE
jgi:hypothetical protein